MPQPIGVPPSKFTTDLLNPDVVLTLSSWGQFDQANSFVAPSEFDTVSAYNVHAVLDHTNHTIVALHKIYSNFGMQSMPDVLSRTHDAEKHLLNICRNSLNLSGFSTLDPKHYPLQANIQLFRDIVFGAESVSLSLMSL
jgi:hypothetical protein